MGLKKFHQYLGGHKFTIVTNHKPLLGLFGETKSVPQMLPPRMQRWALTLAAYEYQIIHNGIKHITSAPHHPTSNGLSERAVGMVKEGVKRMHGGDLETKLARFLFDYRITPHSTTGIAPAELLMHRQLKPRLHLIRPDVGVKVVNEQIKQKTKHDRHAKVRTFQPGELVYALRYHGNIASWVLGSIHRQYCTPSHRSAAGKTVESSGCAIGPAYADGDIPRGRDRVL